jgi:hypothetical protein
MLGWVELGGDEPAWPHRCGRDRDTVAGETLCVAQYRADVGRAGEHPVPAVGAGPEDTVAAHAVECAEWIGLKARVTVEVEVPYQIRRDVIGLGGNSPHASSDVAWIGAGDAIAVTKGYMTRGV